jgi:hypothetical protein
LSAPLPPPDLNSRIPEIISLDSGVIVERFFNKSNEPVYFDRSLKGRLNAPDGSFGVLYTAAQLRGAFAETFLRDPSRTTIPLDLLNRKARVRLRATRDLKLIKLAGIGLGRLGRLPKSRMEGYPTTFHRLGLNPSMI